VLYSQHYNLRASFPQGVMQHCGSMEPVVQALVGPLNRVSERIIKTNGTGADSPD